MVNLINHSGKNIQEKKDNYFYSAPQPVRG